MALEIGINEEQIQSAIRETFAEWQNNLQIIIQQAIDQNEIPPMVPAEGAQLLIAYSQGIFLLAKTENNGALIKKLGERAVNLILVDRR